MLIITPFVVMLYVPRTHYSTLLCHYLDITYVKRLIVVVLVCTVPYLGYTYVSLVFGHKIYYDIVKRKLIISRSFLLPIDQVTIMIYSLPPVPGTTFPESSMQVAGMSYCLAKLFLSTDDECTHHVICSHVMIGASQEIDDRSPRVVWIVDFWEHLDMALS